MHIHKTKSFAIAFLLMEVLFTRISRSGELARFDYAVTGFADHGSPGSALFISQNGEVTPFENGQIGSPRTYRIQDSQCMPKLQNTADEGMTLAFPFLVGLGRICMLDDRNHSIRQLGEFGLPANAFSVAFAGEDLKASYFLVNGRPWRTDGYLLLVTIDKHTLSIGLRELVTGVPGYSGAMLLHEGAFWVTVWQETNDLYRIPTVNLNALIQSGLKAKFLDIATKAIEQFDGMSRSMLGNANAFLYDNLDFPAYVLDRSNGSRTEVQSPDCSFVSGYGAEWLRLCGGRVLESVTIRN